MRRNGLLFLWIFVFGIQVSTAQSYTFKNNDFVNKLNEKVDSIAHKLFRLRKNKQIDVYTNNSLNAKMTDEEFEESLYDTTIVRFQYDINDVYAFKDSLIILKFSDKNKMKLYPTFTETTNVFELFQTHQLKGMTLRFYKEGYWFPFVYYKFDDLKKVLSEEEYNTTIVLFNLQKSLGIFASDSLDNEFVNVLQNYFVSFYSNVQKNKFYYYLDSQCTNKATELALDSFSTEYHELYISKLWPESCFSEGINKVKLYDNKMKLYIKDYRNLKKEKETKILYIKQSEFIPLLPSWMQFLMKEVFIDKENQ